jgi:hypothetical protein
MPLNSPYSTYQFKTTSYTVLKTDDVVTFQIAAPATATLPKAGTCPPMSLQNQKQIISSGSSGDTLTIAVASGDVLLGVGTLAAGQNTIVTSQGTNVWTSLGGGGQAGTSGYSGVSGFSGYSGVSGYSGYSGLSGFSGYSGASGFSGYSGASGFSGYSGISGASGKSGYSGTSGFSGYSG